MTSKDTDTMRLTDDRGFSLIEMLTVTMIIGILSAIALPQFLGQRQKAHDAHPKVYLRAAATALETIHIDKQTYASTKADLEAERPDLKNALGLTIAGTAKTFRVEVGSGSGGRFALVRLADGSTRHACTKPGVGGCLLDSTW